MQDNSVAVFADDLARGRTGEVEVAGLLGVPLGNLHRDLGDMLAPTFIGLTPVEVKTDFRFPSTGNIAIELLDVQSNRTVATGVAKSVHLAVPTLYIHQLGSGGDFLIYDPSSTLRFLAASAGRLGRVVAVPNRGYRTVNVILEAAQFVAACYVRRENLRDSVRAWHPTVTGLVDDDEALSAVRTVLASHRGAQLVVEPLNIKGDPAEHCVFRTSMLESAQAAELREEIEFAALVFA